jgi:hypothetical protein
MREVSAEEILGIGGSGLSGEAKMLVCRKVLLVRVLVSGGGLGWARKTLLACELRQPGVLDGTLS